MGKCGWCWSILGYGDFTAQHLKIWKQFRRILFFLGRGRQMIWVDLCVCVRVFFLGVDIYVYIIYIYLELVCPLFLGLQPSRRRPKLQSKQVSFSFYLYIKNRDQNRFSLCQIPHQKSVIQKKQQSHLWKGNEETIFPPPSKGVRLEKKTRLQRYLGNKGCVMVPRSPVILLWSFFLGGGKGNMKVGWIKRMFFFWPICPKIRTKTCNLPSLGDA